jgi:hypothetical protein
MQTPDLVPVDPAIDALRPPKPTKKQQKGRPPEQQPEQQQQQKGPPPPPRLRYDLLMYRRGQRCIAANVAQALKRPFMARGLFPLRKYLEAAKRAITEAAKPTLLGDPTNQIPCVYLDHGGTMAALDITG